MFFLKKKKKKRKERKKRNCKSEFSVKTISKEQAFAVKSINLLRALTKLGRGCSAGFVLFWLGGKSRMKIIVPPGLEREMVGMGTRVVHIQRV